MSAHRSNPAVSMLLKAAVSQLVKITPFICNRALINSGSRWPFVLQPVLHTGLFYNCVSAGDHFYFSKGLPSFVTQALARPVPDQLQCRLRCFRHDQQHLSF